MGYVVYIYIAKSIKHPPETMVERNVGMNHIFGTIYRFFNYRGMGLCLHWRGLSYPLPTSVDIPTRELLLMGRWPRARPCHDRGTYDLDKSI
jgi:hypothetical protein